MLKNGTVPVFALSLLKSLLYINQAQKEQNLSCEVTGTPPNTWNMCSSSHPPETIS